MFNAGSAGVSLNLCQQQSWRKQFIFFFTQMLSCVKFDRVTMLQPSEIAAHLNKSVTELNQSASKLHNFFDCKLQKVLISPWFCLQLLLQTFCFVRDEAIFIFPYSCNTTRVKLWVKIFFHKKWGKKRANWICDILYETRGFEVQFGEQKVACVRG